MMDITHEILVSDGWNKHEDGTYEKLSSDESVLIQLALSERSSPSVKMYTIYAGDDYNHYEPVKAIPHVDGIAGLRSLVELFLS